LKLIAVLTLILFLSILLVIPLSSASEGLVASVQTDKPWYNISENINVYGSILSGGLPLPNTNVALEIHDPVGNPVIVRSVQTNSSGVYSLTLKLSQEALTGSYNIYVSCTYGGQTAFSSTSFGASALALTISTNKDSYKIGDNITIMGNVTFNSLKLQGAFVALEVQDPNATPIIVRVLETDTQGNCSLTFQAVTGSPLGTYIVFASVSHEGSVATAGTSFTLKHPTTSADINGDGLVNILDLALVARAYGSRPSDARWDPRCDLNYDDLINIIDITTVASQFRW
jgi:hypothetical protein